MPRNSGQFSQGATTYYCGRSGWRACCAVVVGVMRSLVVDAGWVLLLTVVVVAGEPF